MKNVKEFYKKIFPYLGVKGVLNWIPDEIYLKINFRIQTNKKLNLENPITYNEKLQWLKLNDRNPIYTKLVDKYEVRKYITQSIGEEYLIPCLGIYNEFDEINFDLLPPKFVLKCTHDSGSVILCKDKKTFDTEKANRILTKKLKQNHYNGGREWPYKHITPRIICEEYIVDEYENDLKDYKIFCFNGKPKLIQVDYNRFTNHKRNLYTTNWEFIDASIQYPNDRNVNIEKPKSLEKMLNLATILSQSYPHVRVDFYNINEKIYFGELTFYHESGFAKYEPKELENLMGSWITLEKDARGNKK